MSSFNNFNRPLMIGDYADIIFNNEQLYRYYIIRLDADGIIIEPMNDFTQTILIQPDINNNYQIVAYEGLHSINFVENASDTPFFERDYTQAPVKIINITDVRDEYFDYIELKNGIILYATRHHNLLGELGFSDPHNIINSNTNKSDAITFFNPAVPQLNDELYEIFNLTSDNDVSDEIFIYLRFEHKIVKLNPNDLSLTDIDETPRYTYGHTYHVPIDKDEPEWEKIYDEYIRSKFALRGGTKDDPTITEAFENSQYKGIYPLKDKKFLCILEDKTMYILNTITKHRIYIISSVSRLNLDWVGYNYITIRQLSDGDIIMSTIIPHPKLAKFEYYRINIYNGHMHTIASFDYVVKLITILQDDNFLLWDTEIKAIQIWKPLAGLSGQFINIFYVNELKLKPSKHIPEKIVSELLINGDVLFSIDDLFYLFKYDTQKITKLSLFPRLHLSTPINSIKQLKNGNILVNIDGNLKILEFPKTNHIKTNYINTVPVMRNYINAVPITTTSVTTNYDELANELNSLKLISD